MARIRRHKEGITVAGGPRDICGGDNPASPDMALDYKKLTEAFAKPLRQHSGNAIDTAASGNDDRRRPHRVATFTRAGQHAPRYTQERLCPGQSAKLSCATLNRYALSEDAPARFPNESRPFLKDYAASVVLAKVFPAATIALTMFA